ncbi:recombinase family protein [Halorubrum ezzemoulense]|uniref:recombinase family protein n=1 Tax=Halorubrum ezzemoulense TaxID=337243 RepID=UPI00232FA8E4|nr:recombinase family protein [Halorubrum ezzemoulense]MDB9301253.1 recombinase family protein [Halorubrum ezzemoulense]
MGQIGIYVRVSTEDQSVERQLEATTEYADSRLGAGVDELEIYRDKSTGTDTERSGYQDMMDDLEELEIVVVKSITRISRSIRDLDRTVERFADAGTELRIIDEGLEIRPDDEDPFQRAVYQLLGVFAELEAAMIRMRTREGIAARQANDDYHHGRAPLGFSKDDGRLIEGKNYDHVVTVLEMVQKGEMSKRKAARELDTTRSTIGSAVDRGELYGI